jgi:hypothetical protein
MEKRLLRSPSFFFKNLKEKSWGTIIVDEEQIDHWYEAMPAGTESCPSWYSVRLFKGTEISPGVNKQPEYWLGICNVFLLPILPIPMIGEEIVIKLGDNLDYYNDLHNEHRTHIADELMRYPHKYFTKIINKATVKFKNINVTYNNDEIWAVNK